MCRNSPCQDTAAPSSAPACSTHGQSCVQSKGQAATLAGSRTSAYETPLGNSSFLDSIVSGVTGHHGIPPSCLGGCFPGMVWSVDTTIHSLERITDLQILDPLTDAE